MLLDCGGKPLDLSSPRVMGVLNVSPDSYCVSSHRASVEAALLYTEQMLLQGAAIIDVGGEATNPGVRAPVSVQEELDRVIPVIEALATRMDVPISVDTSKPEVIEAAVAHGAGFINDVRALRLCGSLEAAAQAGVPVCLMHMAFPFDDEPIAAWDDGGDAVNAVRSFLQARIRECLAVGIRPDHIVIDPGIGGGGFGKDLQQNLDLLANLHHLKFCDAPILVGVSRKMFIGELLNLPVEQRLHGSLAAAVVAVSCGASIIRAHDVGATVEALRVAGAILERRNLAHTKIAGLYPLHP